MTPIPLFVICAAGVLLMACVPRETNEVDSSLSSSAKPSADVKTQVASVQKNHAEKKQLNQLAIKAKRRPEMLARMASSSFYQQKVFFDQIEESRENYQHFTDNEIFKSSDNPVSTFSVDVDTGAYSNVRRFLNQGQLPQRDAVRSEELINYFSYQYKYPKNKNQPFSINTEIAPTPWNKNSYLLHIGLQAYQSVNEQRIPSNLVFLVDVSGSMQSRDKLQLLKSGLKLLINQLDEHDRISIVSYAGSTDVVLKPTKGDQNAEISMALNRLSAGGSTNGASAIQLAYQMARQSFIKGGVNRIILATDGDFNVGVTHFETLKQMVEEKRKTGVSLTTLGFGRGNYNDHLMEQLADAGNGNYSYIDNLNEARKVLVEEMNSTLNTVANDVKIQIEFNPQQISEYRLIGYENRVLKQEEFNNDKVDAGDIGENHTVTAIYEVVFTDSDIKQLENNRYGSSLVVDINKNYSNELAFLRLRYKKNSQGKSLLIEKPLYRHEVIKEVNLASNNFKFSASVAAFAQQLRGGKYLRDFSYNDILELAKKSRGEDASGYRGEFIQLVSLAKALDS
jgi:Ca-activated chloride channel homolog